MAHRDDEFHDVLASRLPTLDDVLDFIRRNCDPDDVFDDKQLEQWATKHGWQEARDTE